MLGKLFHYLYMGFLYLFLCTAAYSSEYKENDLSFDIKINDYEPVLLKPVNDQAARHDYENFKLYILKPIALKNNYQYGYDKIKPFLNKQNTEMSYLIFILSKSNDACYVFQYSTKYTLLNDEVTGNNIVHIQLEIKNNNINNITKYNNEHSSNLIRLNFDGQYQLCSTIINKHQAQ
ncbi:hypothetical protein [Cysteiniphilum sp. QT6929]|uniref:hypothetical protein n=1 Tax=Cysteiniphilum sp. QT6929 TaxID=2975055 RepID=UPI0024B372C6|nr:hypothetical protein [Cysteiniphilum sp. QT6929]WHN65883.1 hypothetical protein NYP54_01280 [Cysteiniphilum sp. QT6929]